MNDKIGIVGRLTPLVVGALLLGVAGCSGDSAGLCGELTNDREAHEGWYYPTLEYYWLQDDEWALVFFPEVGPDDDILWTMSFEESTEWVSIRLEYEGTRPDSTESRYVKIEQELAIPLQERVVCYQGAELAEHWPEGV